jgi:hypothetical protein
MTGAELLSRYRNKTLVWCDENGTPAADQTTPTEYIRPLTKAKAERAVQIAWLKDALAACPEFERCDADGTPNRKGTHWQLRDDRRADDSEA